MFKFDLQLFGGGKGDSTTTTSSYTPTAQEVQLLQYAVNNADTAQGGINSMLNQFNSGVNSSQFQNILGDASNMVASGQNAISNSANGVLGQNYQSNLADTYSTLANNTVGNAISSAANRGVMNGSAANKAMSNATEQVNNALLNNYSNALSQQSQLGSQQIAAATAGYTPYSTLANLAGNTQNSFITSPLGAIHGSGTTSSTNEQNQGWGSALGTAAMLFAMG